MVIVHVADPGVYHINIAEIKVYGKGGKNIIVQNINIQVELPHLHGDPQYFSTEIELMEKIGLVQDTRHKPTA